MTLCCFQNENAIALRSSHIHISICFLLIFPQTKWERQFNFHEFRPCGKLIEFWIAQSLWFVHIYKYTHTVGICIDLSSLLPEELEKRTNYSRRNIALESDDFLRFTFCIIIAFVCSYTKDLTSWNWVVPCFGNGQYLWPGNVVVVIVARLGKLRTFAFILEQYTCRFTCDTQLNQIKGWDSIVNLLTIDH